MNKISHANDLTLVLPAFIAPHNYLGPVPPSPLAPVNAPAAIAVEVPVPMFWPPGMALGQNKFANTVLHMGFPIAQAGHDCGFMIPHVQVAPSPANTLTALQILFSGRATKFQASTVKVGGAPTGCNTLISLFPAPMMNCADPMDLPTSTAPTSHLNTVTVGMTWGDFILGLVDIAANMLLGYLTRGFDSGAASVIRGASRRFIAREIARQAGKQFVQKLINFSVKKQALAAAMGAVRIATQGEGSMKITVGTPYLGAEVEVARKDGEMQVSAAERHLDRESKVTLRDGEVTTETSNTDLDGSKETTKTTGGATETTEDEGMMVGGPSTWGRQL